MENEIATIRLKILELMNAIRSADSYSVREYAKVMLKELELYLSVLEGQSPQPASTESPTKTPSPGASGS